VGTPLSVLQVVEGKKQENTNNEKQNKQDIENRKMPYGFSSSLIERCQH
jgi:hypothetical protein